MTDIIKRASTTVAAVFLTTAAALSVSQPASATTEAYDCVQGTMTVWDNASGNGNRTWFMGRYPNLAEQGWDNRIVSGRNCTQFTYTFYTGPNFTGTRYVSQPGSWGQFPQQWAYSSVQSP